MKPAPCRHCDALVIGAHSMAGVPLVLDAQPVDGGLFLLELAEGATEPGANARSKPKGLGYRVHVCPSTAGPERRFWSEA